MENESWGVTEDMKSLRWAFLVGGQTLGVLKWSRVTSILRWLNSNTHGHCSWYCSLCLDVNRTCEDDSLSQEVSSDSAHVIKFLLGDSMLIKEEYPGWAWPDFCAIHWDRVYSAAHTSLDWLCIPGWPWTWVSLQSQPQDKLFKIGLKPLLSSETWSNSKYSLPSPAVLGNAEDYVVSCMVKSNLKKHR